MMILDIPLPLGYALGVLLFLLWLAIRHLQHRRAWILEQRRVYLELKATNHGWEAGV